MARELTKQSKIDRRMCQRSLYYLCKEVLGYKDFVPHIHGDLCHFITHPSFGRFRQATVPRSWFKTWTCTIAKSLWLTLPDEENLYKEIFPYKGPNCRILIASNVIDLAAKIINTIKRQWMENDRLKAAFPELVPDFNKTRWSDHCAEIKRTIRAQEGSYTAVGVGGAVIGQHFDHIIEDDLVYAKKDDFTGQELMPNQEDIDNAIGWHKLAFSLLSDPQTNCIENIGTRWAPHDLIDYIRRYELQYSKFEISATKNAVWPILDASQLNWPERYDIQTLENIRASQGVKIFETQYLNRPRAGEDVTFQVSCIHQHDSIDSLPKGIRWMTFIDLASWGDNKRICRNVVLTGGRDDKNNLWIARCDAGRFNPTEVIEFVKSHVRQFESKVFVEEVGYQVALRHFARQDMETEGGFHYDIQPIPRDNRKNAKELRINSLEPVVKMGALHILKGMTSLVQEFEDYPYSSTKDIVDVIGYLHRYAKRPAGSVVRTEVSPFSMEAIEKELKDKKASTQYPIPCPLTTELNWTAIG